MIFLDKRLCCWGWAEFAVIMGLGTVLHFAYEQSGKNDLVGAIAAVNESTWEHMKIFLVPSVLFSLVQLPALGGRYRQLGRSRFFAGVWGLLLIPVLFYTLRGALGDLPDWVNIGIFAVSAAVSAIKSYFALQKDGGKSGGASWLWLLLLLLLTGVFIYGSYRPLELPIFRDPLDGSYGMIQRP